MDEAVRVRPLTGDDVGAMARIHVDALPTDFVALLGERYARETFYPAVLRGGGFGIVAEDREGVAGFVLFAPPGHSLLADLGAGGLWRTAKAVIARRFDLAFFRYAVDVLVMMLRMGAGFPGTELAYIAVRPGQQSRGLGSRLTEEGITESARRGHQRVWVKTLCSTPETVRFYVKLGFSLLVVLQGRCILGREARAR